MVSCASEDCIGNRSSLPLAGFYSSQTVPQAIQVDSINIIGVGAPGDSILLSSLSSHEEVYLPFRLDGGETSYIIRYMRKDLLALGVQDEITFDYTSEPRFLSPTCGAMYDFKIRSIQNTRMLIDSLTCPAGIIDNQPVQNIRIYFRTQELQMPAMK